MWFDEPIRELEPSVVYSREELYEILRKVHPQLTPAAFSWLLWTLQRERRVMRLGRDRYVACDAGRPAYEPYYSERALALQKLVEEQYPLVDFTVVESVQLNEFLNHLIAQDTIYLQVNRQVSEFVFDLVREEIPGVVLYRPSVKEFYRYWKRDCVVVLNQISEAPVDFLRPHEVTLEKLLVDVLAERTIQAVYDPAEYPWIIENALRMYALDLPKLLRYARRRNRGREVQSVLEEVRAQSEHSRRWSGVGKH